MAVRRPTRQRRPPSTHPCPGLSRPSLVRPRQGAAWYRRTQLPPLPGRRHSAGPVVFRPRRPPKLPPVSLALICSCSALFTFCDLSRNSSAGFNLYHLSVSRHRSSLLTPNSTVDTGWSEGCRVYAGWGEAERGVTRPGQVAKNTKRKYIHI